MARTNRPELDELTDAQRAAVLDGADALAELTDFKRRTFDKWMTVARGVAPLCQLADRPGMSRKARTNLLRDNGYGSLNESTVSRLLHMAKLETAIRVWRDTLTQNKRDSWNSPTSICNRCPPVRKAIEEERARKGTKPRRKRADKSPAVFERAIDTVLDHLHGLDADNRLAVIERILSPFGLKLASADTTTAAAKLRKAKAKAEAKPEPRAKAKAPALRWQTRGRVSIAKTPDYTYEVKPDSENDGCYEVSRIDNDPIGGLMLMSLHVAGGVKTPDEARAIAEAHHAKRQAAE